MLFGPVRGNPYRSIRHICRLPRPTASMDRTFISGFSRTSPPSVPTQAASIQCFFRYPCAVRLYFVRPPVPHSTGKPAVFNRSNRAHRGVPQRRFRLRQYLLQYLRLSAQELLYCRGAASSAQSRWSGCRGRASPRSYYDLNCIRNERVQKFNLYLLVEVIKDNPPSG